MRQISRQDLDGWLAEAEDLGAQITHGPYDFMSRRGRDVEVIYVENAERMLVVTVYRVGEYD